MASQKLMQWGLKTILWFWHLFSHNFGIVLPKVGIMRDQRCQNPDISGLWWCLLLNLMIPKRCQKRLIKIRHLETQKMHKTKRTLVSEDAFFWFSRCQNDAQNSHQIHERPELSKLYMSYPSCNLVWDLKMPKWCINLSKEALDQRS